MSKQEKMTSDQKPINGDQETGIRGQRTPDPTDSRLPIPNSGLNGSRSPIPDPGFTGPGISDIAIKVENLTKIYKLYDSPQDRLKESLHPLRKRYHHEF